MTEEDKVKKKERKKIVEDVYDAVIRQIKLTLLKYFIVFIAISSIIFITWDISNPNRVEQAQIEWCSTHICEE